MSRVVSIKDVVKTYQDFYAVNHISVQVESGEFFTLLGPSGCGKTTLLRMIAGFNDIDGGEIYFDDVLINNLPAQKRNIGMVFQNYAIFPHMTVADNVGYGLKARKIKGSELEKQVQEGLDLMKIGDLAKRRPSQLSGGQQQRIALARAIVIRPDILLMDEPLSNLDAKLRLEMRSAIRKLQKSLGVTTIYVTHDQEEALAISDRIAVMNAGKIEQVGKPNTIYTKPVNQFVANFIGTSNFISGKTVPGGFAIMGLQKIEAALKNNYQGDILIATRPEEVRIVSTEESAIHARVTSSTFLGTHYEFELILNNNEQILINRYDRAAANIKINDKVGLLFSSDQLNVFTADGREALL